MSDPFISACKKCDDLPSVIIKADPSVLIAVTLAIREALRNECFGGSARERSRAFLVRIADTLPGLTTEERGAIRGDRDYLEIERN